MDQLGSSIRAGMSISTAVEDVAQCKFIHPSMRKRFAKLSADLQMGITVADAFQHFADDCGNEDAADIALAIAVQDTVGGHEADVVLSIANNIEERIMMRREIKSIFAATSVSQVRRISIRISRIPCIFFCSLRFYVCHWLEVSSITRLYEEFRKGCRDGS